MGPAEEPAAQEHLASHQETASGTAHQATPAPSHTLESTKSAGFAVDFGDTAASSKGVLCFDNCDCLSLIHLSCLLKLP